MKPANRTVILDGGLSTELERLGIAIRAPWWTSLPLLSSSGREALRTVHAAYVSAGADIITANTFRSNLRAMRRNGLDAARAAELVRVAVETAMRTREEAGAGHVRIAASVAPVEDCYQPRLTPPDDQLAEEHLWMAETLAASRVDLLLIETMNSAREAVAATRAARIAGLPALVSFVCREGTALLSGEPLADAARWVMSEGAEAVMVNCSSIGITCAASATLRTAGVPAWGAYPNIEDREHVAATPIAGGVLPQTHDPVDFAEIVGSWRKDGASFLGGCCGTTPQHIAALARQVRMEEAHAPVAQP